MAQRPGLYITFINSAERRVSGGVRGTVAIPLKTYNTGTASEKSFYTVKTETEAVALFGETNIQSIKLALLGGCRDILVYTLPNVDGATVTMEAAIQEALGELETRTFNALAFDGEVSETIQDSTKLWIAEKREEGKHVFYVAGGTVAEDQDITLGNARTERLSDDYVVNVVSGGIATDGTAYSSAEIAPYVASLIAKTPLNQSITYLELPFIDVTKRFKKAEIVSALEVGSLVFFHDGEIVRVEAGVTSSTKKIRAVSSRQAVSTDIRKTVNSQYIGKLNNTPDSRKALMASIKAYLERLEDDNVLTSIAVTEDLQNPSKDDTVNLVVSYVEVDSMEKINLGINL
ncbi:MAG: phage tail sheath subtilisin-like domain-containing protein [Bacillota bacterium]